MDCSLVIPSLGEGETLLGAIRNARRSVHGAEVLVVAHAESADTRERACSAGARWIEAPKPSRGHQLALGAARARGRTLLFLHADTRLPAAAGELVDAALADPRVVGGAFRMCFDRRHPVLDALAGLTRTSATVTILGDQAMFCTREAYEHAGGFEALPAFEDVSLARRLARLGLLVRIPTPVVTSARRFLARGVLRQVTANGVRLFRYHALGTDPRQLAPGERPPRPAARIPPGAGN